MKIRLIIFGVFILSTLVTNFNWLPNGAFLGKEIALIGALSLLALVSLFYKEFCIKIKSIDIVLGVFFIYIFFTILLKPNYFDTTKFFVISLFFLLYYYLGGGFFKDNKQVKDLIIIFLTAFLFESLVGLMQYFGNLSVPLSERFFYVKGHFSNPAPFACFLSFGFTLGSGLLLFYPIGKLNKYILFLLSFLFVAVIILSKSRTAVLCCLFVLLYSLYCKYQHKLKKKFVFLFFSGIGIISSLFLINLNTDSILGRFFIWKISLKIIKDNFLTGIGFGNFQPVYMEHQSEYFALVSHNSKEALLADTINFAFNEFIQLFVETGVIGFLLVIILITIILYNLYKIKNRETVLLSALLLNFLLMSQFSYPLNELPLLIILCTLLFLTRNYFSTIYSKNSHYGLKLTVLSLAIIIGMFWSRNTIKAYSSWSLSKSEAFGGNLNTSIRHFKIANKSLGNNGFFLFNYGASISEEGKCKIGKPILLKASKFYNEHYIWELLGDCQKTENFEEAEFYYKKAINMLPKKFVPNYKLFLLYKLHGKTKNAVYMANKILKKQIKIPSSEIEYIRLECSNFLSEL
ncbi:O-antigen ligase family protein [Algibacter sp. 2305UL17-15]|uniref:O-antigen ligase family protein n=1 Tax=Algibacter sp. 2305UL17-15 TaxID=3231268 RepID=UPI00345A9690